jgi:hypothetical protein
MRLVVCTIIGLVLLFSTGISFAQTPQERILGIYAQVVVQDSSGKLVSYLETSRVTILNTSQFNQLIDQNINQFQASQINISGQPVQMLKAIESIVHSTQTIISQNLITLNTPSGSQDLVYAAHDGYPVVPGDKVTTYWTIIRVLS